eukprot:gnl/TRDRNA2_/TRDRNA2_188435_c0_seq1.p1 gnl/TRDRNA2_/TRDRNA2_188435_c0~~gnl/TRDRNA2_/TRDRNA2_188435_c0_seq1.p1  ORF type:complete len:498 (+),score=141.49 gnl/TRDRNA2_/TRDRNA2_188435_c0_seq1:67-1560(+)
MDDDLDVEALRKENEALWEENEALRKETLEIGLATPRDDGLALQGRLEALRHEREMLQSMLKIGEELQELRNTNQALRQSSMQLRDQNAALQRENEQLRLENLAAQQAAELEAQVAAAEKAVADAAPQEPAAPALGRAPEQSATTASLSLTPQSPSPLEQKATDIAERVRKGDNKALARCSADERKELVAAMMKASLFQVMPSPPPAEEPAPAPAIQAPEAAAMLPAPSVQALHAAPPTHAAAPTAVAAAPAATAAPAPMAAMTSAAPPAAARAPLAAQAPQTAQAPQAALTAPAPQVATTAAAPQAPAMAQTPLPSRPAPEVPARAAPVSSTSAPMRGNKAAPPALLPVVEPPPRQLSRNEKQAMELAERLKKGDDGALIAMTEEQRKAMVSEMLRTGFMKPPESTAGQLQLIDGPPGPSKEIVEVSHDVSMKEMLKMLQQKGAPSSLPESPTQPQPVSVPPPAASCGEEALAANEEVSRELQVRDLMRALKRVQT